MPATDGQLPYDALGYRADGIYVPNVGTVAQQGTLTGTDSTGTPYGTQVVTTLSGSQTTLSTANTGIPVNIPTIVQKINAVSTGSVATLAKAFASANSVGNTIVVVAGCGNGTAMTVADSAGNTYTSVGRSAVSTTFETQIFFSTNILASASNTVTVTNAGATASMAVELYEVSGLLAVTTAQPDVFSTGNSSGGSGTASTSNLAAATPNSLAFLGVGIGTAAQNITANGNWAADGGTNGLVPTTPAGLYQFNSFSQFLGNTVPVAPTATIASSEPWTAVAVIFKPVQLGISGTVQLGGWNYTHITSATTTLVKTGAGILRSVIFGTLVASSSLELDDALTHTTPVISIITPPATVTSVVPFVLPFDVVFSTGLSVTTVGASPDYTIVWR